MGGVRVHRGGGGAGADARGGPLTLHVAIAKRADGSAVLGCTRADGSVTWQRQPPDRARFFVFHDLRHFAVETVLGLTHGFYGLIASGWDIADTEGKSDRGPLPAEAALAEQIVGLLDRERVGGADAYTAEEFNAQLERIGRLRDLGPVRELSAAQLDAIRAETERLHAAWVALPEGRSLELVFAG